MIAVGIDISKAKSTVAVIDSDVSSGKSIHNG